MRISKLSSFTNPRSKLNKLSSEITNKSFSEEIFSSFSKDLESLKLELEKFNEKLDENFSEDNLDQYKSFIKNTITKIYSIMKLVEKVSGKRKDKILKVIEVSDQKLKKILDEIISNNINKLKLKGFVNDLKGIIISLLV
ncbi:MAG: DUF327 family protein [Brevinematia bacterium]|jgi:uncharacterized protein YaaR (DUF327 family)